jgi:hypothetical protein
MNKGSGGDEKGVNLIAHKGCKSHIDLWAGACVDDLDLQPDGTSSGFHVSQRGLRLRVGRIHKHRHANCCRHQVPQECEPLRHQFVNEIVDNRHVAAWPGEAGNQTKPDRVVANIEDDGIVVVAAFAANAEWMPPVAAIAATWRRTNSPASAGSRSN